MAVVGYELLVQRMNTVAFIESDPTDVAVIPRVKVPDGQGGSTWSAPAALASQTVRVVTPSAQLMSTTKRTVDGESVSPDLALVCEFDAVFADGYRLPIDGVMYEVVSVNADLKYETLVEVVRRG